MLNICHITDPSVTWPMWSRVEKEPPRLFISNHFGPLFRQQ